MSMSKCKDWKLSLNQEELKFQFEGYKQKITFLPKEDTDFCSLQTFKLWDEVHQDDGEQSALLSLSI